MFLCWSCGKNRGMAYSEDDIAQAAAGPLEELGLLVEDVKMHAAGVHRRLVVTVDLAGDTTEAVSSDLIEQATRVISEVIDPLPLFNDKPSALEVSSPGALRPLTEPRHFRRNVGRTIEVRPTEGKKTTGVLTGVTGLGIVLEPGSGREPVEFSFDGIEKAQVVLKFR